MMKMRGEPLHINFVNVAVFQLFKYYCVLMTDIVVVSHCVYHAQAVLVPSIALLYLV